MHPPVSDTVQDIYLYDQRYFNGLKNIMIQ